MEEQSKKHSSLDRPETANADQETDIGNQLDLEEQLPQPQTTLNLPEIDPPQPHRVKIKDHSSDDEDGDDDGEILEESPCGRWLKRREQVKYRDVPGIDTAYLAMDTEEGVEVVWNEAQFSGSKKFKLQEDKLKLVFEALTLIEHPNIVKFHRFWTDHGKVIEKTGEKQEPRLIFITEYMSSGSLKQFLRKTKKNMRKIQLQSWKRFCIQILSALNYLHTCNSPIVHGNLTCDTIFIQHNGLVKIGSVAPDIIHRNVKTCRDNIRNLHSLAPELGDANLAPDTPVDIYAFGMCALETAALEINGTPLVPNGSGNGETNSSSSESSTAITEEVIQRTIDSLEDSLQKDFIRSCLKADPRERPTARELLFHPILFEVHSLKLLSAHSLVNSPDFDTTNINETMTDEAILSHYGKDTVMATLKKGDGCITEFKLSDFPVGEKLEKFIEDVKLGIYPITAFATPSLSLSKNRPAARSSECVEESDKSPSTDSWEPEHRLAVSIGALIGPPIPAQPETITVFVRFEDAINRQLSCQLSRSDTPDGLAAELVNYGFVNSRDKIELVAALSRVFVQRAHETAEWHASNGTTETPQPQVLNNENSSDVVHKHSNITVVDSDESERDPQRAASGANIYQEDLDQPLKTQPQPSLETGFSLPPSNVE